MLLGIKKRIRNLYFRMKTRQYKHIKYIFIPNKCSNALIVSFSGFPGCGKRPSFNYMRTLKGIKANKLFLLDDFGYSNDLGSYYLGENGNWFLPQEIPELIDNITMKNRIKTIIMIGSSKGGTSALYYAILCKAKYAVIGAPQYYIGNYLNTSEFIPIIESICGNANEESVAKLNAVVPEIIKENSASIKPKIYCHYSPCEHTYPEHIKDMIIYLRENNYIVYEDNNYSYTNHSDVAKFFPKYLYDIVSNILCE